MAAWEEALIVTISTIGFLSLSKAILQFLLWTYRMLVRRPKNLGTTYGSWAVVTGCTDGIGKAMAFELASSGLNLVLVGRSLEKLHSTAASIRDKHGDNTKLRIVSLDLDKVSGEEIEGEIRREIQGLDVGVLVNNAGSAGEGPRYFHENGEDAVETILKVNIKAVCWVTKAVIQGMLKRKKGAILNIGSGSSVIVPSFPFSAVYAATKAYVAKFSQTLNVEYKEHGIDVQCQVPLYVATKMMSHSIKKSSFFVPSPEEYGKTSLRWIGYESLCIPYLPHSLQTYLLSLVPDLILNYVVFQSKLKMRNNILGHNASNNHLFNSKH